VHDADYFFNLMAKLTDARAFAEPLMLSARTGRAQIDSPKWLDKLEQTYLGVWIAGVLEENLWAHYNFANNVNIGQNVRKNEIANLFETRSETLQSQEDLAQHWQDIGNKGRQRLVEKLRQRAKEIPIHHPLEYAFPGAPDYLAAAAFEQNYSEFGQGYALPATAMSTEETNKFYAQQLAAHAGAGPRVLSYPGLASEDVMNMFGQPAIFANPVPTPHGQPPSGYQPYQFYQFQELPIRP
jgi:hypothetical protein